MPSGVSCIVEAGCQILVWRRFNDDVILHILRCGLHWIADLLSIVHIGSLNGDYGCSSTVRTQFHAVFVIIIKTQHRQYMGLRFRKCMIDIRFLRLSLDCDRYRGLFLRLKQHHRSQGTDKIRIVFNQGIPKRIISLFQFLQHGRFRLRLSRNQTGIILITNRFLCHLYHPLFLQKYSCNYFTGVWKVRI